MLQIAEYFTNPDGSTRLYVARQNVIPNYAGWMMPHDAPYKQDVDRSLLRVIEVTFAWLLLTALSLSLYVSYIGKEDESHFVC